MKSTINTLFTFSTICFLGVSIYASGPSPSSNSNSNNKANILKVQNMAVLDTFVKRAAQGNLMEVMMGDSAITKAASQQVKSFADLMVKDHKVAFQNLATVAQSMGIKLPSSPGTNYSSQIDALSKLAGNAFDKAYMSVMVKAHQLDFAAYQAALKHIPAGPLKSYIESTIPVIQKHLQLAETINAQLNK